MQVGHTSSLPLVSLILIVLVMIILFIIILLMPYTIILYYYYTYILLLSYIATLANVGLAFKEYSEQMKGINKIDLIERSKEALNDAYEIRKELGQLDVIYIHLL